MTKKLSFEYVKAKFEERGYTLLETEYVRASAKMRYKCPNHPGEEFSIAYAKLHTGNGCPKCGRERGGRKRAEAHRNRETKPKKSKYTKAQHQKARNESIRLLDTYCYECPNRELPFIRDIEQHCYKNCPHGIGLELRRCGAILADEDADVVIERYRVKFEIERIDSNSRKEVTV